jgi:hypothetical protein
MQVEACWSVFTPKLILLPDIIFSTFQHPNLVIMPDSIIKVFNTAGPCIPSEHYMLPVLPRVPDINEMIDGKYYFIIHGPRQSGKTTLLKILTDQINSESRFYAINCSLATLRGEQNRNDAISRIVALIEHSIFSSKVEVIKNTAFSYNNLPFTDPSLKVRTILNQLCINLNRELIVFFDEADCLTGSALIIFLAQIRDAYQMRDNENNKFPRSMALVGMRDIRDYLTVARDGVKSTGGASPFNIKKTALTLANFTMNEIKTLYHQHTEASGQIFETNAIERAYYWTQGQPWLVNALAFEAVVKILHNDYKIPITANIIDESAERLIKRRDTHIDSLLERLKEPRVLKVMDSVFASTYSRTPPTSDDRQYCLDLGLVEEDHNHNLRPANPIYTEVMSRVITDELQYAIQSSMEKVVANLKWTEGQMLLMTDLLKEFQNYWCKNSDSFPKRLSDYAAYKLDEATYAFMLLTFLQRVVNSDAKVDREYAQGRGAVDICVTFNKREYIIEVKLKGEDSIDDCKKQLAGYLEKNRETEGWLIIFDRNRNISWENKLSWETVEYAGKTIHIVGC